ncbi:MAG: LuxR family transcriptional regulator [Actinobacteria bacterium]|nr:LuxR family transcriptional regulator [Actinomycetota bacterium]
MAERTADIERGRDAARREAWAEAYDELAAADPSDLAPDDLESLSDAAWWLSKIDESIGARQQAYAGFAASGDKLRAASNAGRLSVEHFLREEPAVGAGWLMRAQRHLEGQSECIEHGFLAVLEATVARFTGDLDGAMALAKRATATAVRFDNRDVWAMGIHTEGLLLIARGDIADGLARLDEAMTSVVAGELGSFFTGIVYCNVIAACLELADLRRAHEWSEASRAWCETLPPESPYPGMCRINRAEVSSLRGAWSEAEAESSRASRELMSFDPMAAAQAFYGTGEIRRRMGNLAGAEESFARAHEIGFEPQPGLALLRLAQGKPDAARTGLRIALTSERGAGCAGRGSSRRRWTSHSPRATSRRRARRAPSLMRSRPGTRRPPSTRLPPPRAERSASRKATSEPRSRASAALSLCGRRSDFRTRRLWLGRDMPSRCGARRTRTTPAWSSGPRWPRSNVSVR